MKRVITWIFWNLGAVACVWYGGFQQQQWALNLLSFASAWMVLTYTPCALVAQSRMKIREAGRSVPVWLSKPIDAVVLIGAVATGHFFIAIGWLWGAVFEEYIYGNQNVKPETE